MESSRENPVTLAGAKRRLIDVLLAGRIETEKLPTAKSASLLKEVLVEEALAGNMTNWRMNWAVKEGLGLPAKSV